MITDAFGWRSAFLVNLPVGAILFVAATAAFVETRDDDAKAVAGRRPAATGTRVATGRLGARASHGSRLAGGRGLFKQPTFLGAAFAMLGYAAGAQVLIFFLPLFLQNVFGFTPTIAGLGMLPFALPMFLTPRFGAHLAKRYSGRAILTFGLATTALGNLLLGALAFGGATYPTFLAGMVIAGAGAGLLNGETAKVLQGAVPVQRSGMASGLSATTRFVGLLLGIAVFGAVLSHAVILAFVSAGSTLGLEPDLASEAAKRVASGDLAGAITGASGPLRAQLHLAATTAFSSGFALSSLVAAAVAAITGMLAFVLVRAVDTAPATGEGARTALTATD